jgi:hypothetical protein
VNILGFIERYTLFPVKKGRKHYNTSRILAMDNIILILSKLNIQKQTEWSIYHTKLKNNTYYSYIRLTINSLKHIEEIQQKDAAKNG